jgi:hypothetical protein
MGDNLAQLLYEALRANAPAGSDMAPWGLLESAEREAFEAMATTARQLMAARFVADIDREFESDASAETMLNNLHERWAK